ncbi:MAG TPA: hypothetical protein VF339_01315 [Gammaproteobacteria bacterium]
MSRLRGLLLGVALALPLAATGGTGEVSAVGKTSTMTSIQSGPASDRCCWVFYMGMWFCFAC